MFKFFNSKYFYRIWLILSILVGFFIVYQISNEIIYLNPIKITSGDPIEELERCDSGKTCNISGQFLDVNISDLSTQLGGFDNFFPISAISKFNLKINYLLEGNVFLEVTYPKYSERINDIEILCTDENSTKFSSSKPHDEINSIRPYLISSSISKYFQCEKPHFNFSYRANKEILVGPSEYVKFTTQGKDAIVTLNRISITLEPDWLTKIVIFLISFFLSLGAGSILYSYLDKLGMFRKSTILNQCLVFTPLPKRNEGNPARIPPQTPPAGGEESRGRAKP